MSMAIKKTHSVVVVRSSGRKRVKVHASATAWVVKGTEVYYKDTGARVGAPGRGRIELETLRELPPEDE